jgi:predicted nuclease of restriction endonuclease-like RecB superfamily
MDWAQEAYDKLKNKKEPKFRSQLEKRVATLLTTLGISYEYESTKVPYTIQHNYTPDFVLPNHVYLEAKGYWAAEDRRKILAVKKDNPDIDLRMVFQSPYNKISKRSKTTYAQWCDKHAIPWTAYHEVPLDWLT